MPTSSTAIINKTLQQAADNSNPNEIADVAGAVKLGTMLQTIKITVTGLAAAAAIDVTAAATLAAAVVNKGNNNYASASTPPPNPVDQKLLPPIGHVRTLRVTASGTGGSLGAYIVTDSGGTPIVPPGGASAAVGVATLSDDGKTLTFPNTITGFVLEYTPLPAQDLATTAFNGEV